jgi:tryptophanase
MSALKDLLVPTGGLILTRDEAAYRKAAMQGFLDGAQLNSAGMETLAAALEEITVSDAYIESRVAQVEYLWHRLNAAVPLVQPLGGHAVFVDLKKFLPHLTPEQFPAEALAAFLYQISGVRVTKGPPPAPSQQARGVELLRLAVPARKYLCGHLDDVAEAIRYAYAHRDEVPALKRVDDVSRGKYVPAQFIRL